MRRTGGGEYWPKKYHPTVSSGRCAAGKGACERAPVRSRAVTLGTANSHHGPTARRQLISVPDVDIHTINTSSPCSCCRYAIIRTVVRPGQTLDVWSCTAVCSWHGLLLCLFPQFPHRHTDVSFFTFCSERPESFLPTRSRHSATDRRADVKCEKMPTKGWRASRRAS